MTDLYKQDRCKGHVYDTNSPSPSLAMRTFVTCCGVSVGYTGKNWLES